MITDIRSFFLLAVGFLFCTLGCTRDRSNVLLPDHISSPMDVHESVDAVEASFEQDILPILTARCALAGCHVADGPHGLDFRTYESFIAGGEQGPAFIARNAEESTVVKQIVSGKMPPGGPPLTDAEIQLFIDWINQQDAQVDVIKREHSDEHAIEKLIDEDMNADHDGEDDHEEMDEEHEDDNGHEDENGDHDDDDDDD